MFPHKSSDDMVPVAISSLLENHRLYVHVRHGYMFYTEPSLFSDRLKWGDAGKTWIRTFSA
jgi:hypothetical protein